MKAAAAPLAVVEPAQPGSMAEALRASLSPGMWQQLSDMAAGESMHYANAAIFAFETRDHETLRRCLHSLRGLALSFKHPAMLVALLEVDTSGPTEANLKMICDLAGKWPR